MNGGAIIAKVLKEQGVKFLFTLCGGHISPIFVEAEKAGIRVIDTRHEVNAVFAADAVSRLSGVPGVAAVTAGPGLTNTITAVKNALLAQSPLVLLGGAAATILKGRGSLQDIDQMALMKPNVKWAASLKRVKDIVPTLQKAFAIAQTGVPGPVFVECPIDLLYDESLVREWYGAKSDVPPRNLKDRVIKWYVNRHVEGVFAGKNSIQFTNRQPPIQYPHHSGSQLSQLAQQLQTAQKPLLLIGSGAVMFPQKAAQLAAAVHKLGIPVYLSGMARGLLGAKSSIQFRHHRREALRQADLIILAGVPCDFRLDYGQHLNRDAVYININRSKEDLNKNKKPDIGILADPQECLIALAGLQSTKPDISAWLQTLANSDAKREENISQRAQENLANGINPLQLFRSMNTQLPDNAILIADGGDFVGTAAYTLRPPKPLSWLDPGAFGTLGVGAGFALGAKLCFPDAEVYIIWGDGSSAYSLMEYDTFVRHHLPVISVIGNDAAWAQIARDQIDILQSTAATNLAYSDYEMVGQAFGANGKRVATLEDFNQALTQARQGLAQGKPYIINAIIGKSDFRKGSISM